MESFLSQHQRQPKLYIDLPSGGKFYNEKIIENKQYVQIPVYSMTAMDEINLKTPDALFNGIATLNVIKSCIPTILDPNELVRYDIEYLLLAIKIASEGEKYNLETKCPSCNEENGFEVDLSLLLSKYDNMPVEHNFKIGSLSYLLQPIRYKKVTEYGLQTYNIQRQLAQISLIENLTSIEREQKITALVQDLSKLNNQATIAYIASITDNTDTETNTETISDFILNNEKLVARTILEEVKKFVNFWNFPMLPVQCQNSECNHNYQTTITIDYTSFFDKLLSTSRTLS